MPGAIAMQVAWGLAGSGLIAVLAWRRRALTLDGALGAVAVGTLTFGLGGWGLGTALIAFFVTSTVWGRIRARRRARAEAHYAKGARRDLQQVLANGGVCAGLCALAWGAGRPDLLVAAGGALAAACADTWATELGVLSSGQPRLVTTWRPVAAGTSGAVSAAGLLAAAAGAALMAALVASLPGAGGVWGAVGSFGAMAAAGWFAALVDSALGATVQGQFCCRVCGQATEKTRHCETPAVHTAGVPRIGNDLVNLLATGTGAALAWLLL